MCRAIRVLCAAPGSRRLAEVKRAAVGAEWELVGGAASLAELQAQVEDLEPDVVVVDAGLGEKAVGAVARARPTARIVSLGAAPGAHEVAASLQEIRAAILSLPRPAGPVGP
jgi:AmiR/NasT family two-component response regulator